MAHLEKGEQYLLHKMVVRMKNLSENTSVKSTSCPKLPYVPETVLGTLIHNNEGHSGMKHAKFGPQGSSAI